MEICLFCILDISEIWNVFYTSPTIFIHHLLSAPPCPISSGIVYTIDMWSYCMECVIPDLINQSLQVIAVTTTSPQNLRSWEAASDVGPPAGLPRSQSGISVWSDALRLCCWPDVLVTPDHAMTASDQLSSQGWRIPFKYDHISMV